LFYVALLKIMTYNENTKSRNVWHVIMGVAFLNVQDLNISRLIEKLIHIL